MLPMPKDISAKYVAKNMTINHNHRILSALICFFALITHFSCAPPPPRIDHAALNKRPQPRINIAGLEKRIHDLINKERRKQGLSQLAWDDRLAQIARRHSQDMASKNYFSHNSPDGRDFSDRYKQAGYTCGVRVGRTIHTGAENILQNNLYDSVTTVNGVAYYDWNSEQKIAETTVQGWMNSPGHRKNILTPHWRNEGIGVVIAPDDKVYITQNFC